MLLYRDKKMQSSQVDQKKKDEEENQRHTGAQVV